MSSLLPDDFFAGRFSCLTTLLPDDEIPRLFGAQPDCSIGASGRIVNRHDRRASP
jgi:hypothetical protein